MSLAPLLAKAFHTGRAADANAEIMAMRDAQSSSGADALSYELVADAGVSLEALAAKVLPKLVYFLDCRGMRLPNAPGVFVSLFVGEQLYFVHGTDFLSVLIPASGFSAAHWVEKHGAATRGE